jgi:hypothetical protein
MGTHAKTFQGYCCICIQVASDLFITELEFQHRDGDGIRIGQTYFDGLTSGIARFGIYGLNAQSVSGCFRIGSTTYKYQANKDCRKR